MNSVMLRANSLAVSQSGSGCGQRHHDVQALAAGGLHPALEAQVLQQLADGERRFAQRWIGEFGAGIEIEGEPVGLRGLAASPRPSCAVRPRRPARGAAVLRANRRPRNPDPCRRSESCTTRRPALDFSRKCFWKNGCEPCVLRRMRQRPVLVVRHRHFADGGEVFGELQLGDAVVRKQHAIGMRESLPATWVRPALARCARLPRARFSAADFAASSPRPRYAPVLRAPRSSDRDPGACRDSAAGAGCRLCVQSCERHLDHELGLHPVPDLAGALVRDG